MSDGTLHCDACERDVPREDAIRTETTGDLDPRKWQSFCCPDCGRRIETVFVADERGDVGGE